MADQGTLIEEFKAITNEDEDRSRFYLESANWDLNVALSSFYDHSVDMDAVPFTPPQTVAAAAASDPDVEKKEEEPLDVRVAKYGNRYGIDPDYILKHSDKMRNMILAENRVRPEDTDSSFDEDLIEDSGNESSGSWENFMQISKGNVIRRKKVKKSKEPAKPKTLEEKIHEAYWNRIAESKAILTEEDVKTFQETGTIPRFQRKPPARTRKSSKKAAKDLRNFAKTSGNDRKVVASEEPSNELEHHKSSDKDDSDFDGSSLMSGSFGFEI